MANYHFISYSPTDGKQSAFWLSTELEVRSWIDEAQLTDTDDWVEAVAEAIQTCNCLLFVLTDDATDSSARCLQEWRRAIKYKKPIVVLRFSNDVEVPFRLENRKLVDFATDKERALNELNSYLTLLPTNEGQLLTLQEQLADAERDIQYAPSDSKQRVSNEIDTLKQQIGALERVIEDPFGVADQVEKRIALGIERQRRPIRADQDNVNADSADKQKQPIRKIRFINPPPTVAPRYFQNRFVETKLIGEFIEDDASRLLTIDGRGGVGKTAMVCRVLKALEQGKLPDDGKEMEVAGIIYMSGVGSRILEFSNLFADLLLLIEPKSREPLIKLHENPQATVARKLKELLPHLPAKPVVVLLDNFEDVVDRESSEIRSDELKNALIQLLQFVQNPIKIIITTRVRPKGLAYIEPGRQMSISLDKGLESPFAETILVEMDADGNVGLRDAPDQLLGQIRDYTRGFPRALEAFYAILSADRDTTIDELLADPSPPEHIVHTLVGEAFSRLSLVDQRVMQGLAVYGHPVPVIALDHLLTPWIPHIDSATSLKRLVNMHFVRKEGNAYYLHPVDREHALAGLEQQNSVEDETERAEIFDRQSLTNRAADYYSQVQLPRHAWNSLDDIIPHEHEFYLRLEAGMDEPATEILSQLDDFLDRRGAFQRKLSMATQLKEQASGHESEMAAWSSIASAQWRTGNMPNAIAAMEQLIRLREAHTSDNFAVLVGKAQLASYQTGFIPDEEILEILQEVLHIIEEEQPWNSEGKGVIHQHIGFTLRRLGYLKDALEDQNIALEIDKRSGDIDRIEGETHNVGKCYEAIGDMPMATKLYREALELANQSQNPLWKANHLSALSDCYASDGDLSNAIDYIQQSLELRREIGDLGGEADDLQSHANYLLDEGQIERAKELAERALEMAQDLGMPLGSYYKMLAQCQLYGGQLNEALRLIQKALDVVDYSTRWDRENLLGIINSRLGNSEEAKSAFESALAQCNIWLSRSTSNPAAYSGKGLAHAGLAVCGVSGEENVQESIAAYTEARRLLSGLGALRRRSRLFEALVEGINKPEDVLEIRECIVEDDGIPQMDDDSPKQTQEQKMEPTEREIAAVEEPSEQYIDFDLHISPEGRVTASSIEGEVTKDIKTQPSNEIQLSLALIDQRQLNAELLKRLGRILYEWLFPGPIHTHFQQTEAIARRDKANLRIRLRAEPETIASLPLEFTYRESGGYFLAVNPSTVFSRYLHLGLPAERVRRRDGPLHMLTIIADPSDQTRLPPDEWESIIQNALAIPIAEGQMTLQTVKQATRKEIRNALLQQKPDIIQFVGHGIYKDGIGYLALVDEETGKTWLVDDERFANLYLGHDEHLGLISLATCESAKSNDPQGFSGIAPKLVQRGVPTVLSMQYKVLVKTAKIFLEDFYSTIATRKPVDWAAQSARNAVALELGLDNREFATPVLYMRAEDGNVF